MNGRVAVQQGVGQLARGGNCAQVTDNQLNVRIGQRLADVLHGRIAPCPVPTDHHHLCSLRGQRLNDRFANARITACHHTYPIFMLSPVMVAFLCANG